MTKNDNLKKLEGNDEKGITLIKETNEEEQKMGANGSKLAVGIILFIGLLYPTWPFFVIPLFVGVPIAIKGIIEIYDIQYRGKGMIYDLPYHPIECLFISLLILNIGLGFIQYYTQ